MLNQTGVDTQRALSLFIIVHANPATGQIVGYNVFKDDGQPLTVRLPLLMLLLLMMTTCQHCGGERMLQARRHRRCPLPYLAGAAHLWVGFGAA